MENNKKIGSLPLHNSPLFDNQYSGHLRACDINRMKDVAGLLRIFYAYIKTEITDDCFNIYYVESTKVFLCCLRGKFFTYAYTPCVGGEVTYKEDFLRWRGQGVALIKPFIHRFILQSEPKTPPYREIIYLKNNETEKPAKPHSNAKKSMLRYLGYDVSARKSLCAFERQTLLKTIIAREYLINKADVVEHIKTNIKRHQHNPKMKRAVIRWQEDLEYIQKVL